MAALSTRGHEGLSEQPTLEEQRSWKGVSPLVQFALLDYRVEYVIWNRQIYNKRIPEKGW